MSLRVKADRLRRTHEDPVAVRAARAAGAVARTSLPAADPVGAPAWVDEAEGGQAGALRVVEVSGRVAETDG